MRLLITGASGLIGGRLVAALAADGIAVRAASRIARPWPAGVEGIVWDAADVATTARACAGVDAVVNLAGMPEAACAADPTGALVANCGGTLSLVTAAVGVGRFVQISTAKVYGNDATGTVSEQSVPRPASHYAITHRASEDYAALHPSAVVMRLANGFGMPAPGTANGWDVIVNDFCRQAVIARRIAIRSDGTASRNFVPMEDVITAIRAAAGGLAPGTYNLGSAASMTLREMAERVASAGEQVLGHPVAVSVGAPDAGRPAARLDFRSNRLGEAGVTLGADADKEIARTLMAARETFAKRSHG